MGHSPACSLPFEPRTARSVRATLGGYLAEHRVTQEVIDDALVVVSELVTNAIRHGRPRPDGTLDVRWGLDGAHLDLEVRDAGAEHRELTPRAPSREATGGRGLAIVEALSTTWWVDGPPGTAVHARIRVR